MSKKKTIRRDLQAKMLRHASNINKLNAMLLAIDNMIEKAKNFQVSFLPEGIVKSTPDIDEYVNKNLDYSLQQKAMRSWLKQWDSAYEDQKPQHIIVPVIKGLTPLESILLGLLSANIRTAPLMTDTLQERSRASVHRALNSLIEKKLVFKVSASMYFEHTWNKKDAVKWAKNYIRSNRNPKGVIPKSYQYGFDKVAARVTKVMRKDKEWNRVAKEPIHDMAFTPITSASDKMASLFDL